jgi:hypothetical protein
MTVTLPASDPTGEDTAEAEVVVLADAAYRIGSGWPLLRHPGTLLMTNHDDTSEITHYLHRFWELPAGGLPLGRALVRPTPGATEQATLALDVLAALGKNPETLRTEKLGANTWDYAQAWLAGTDVTHLLVDRAHRLQPEQVRDLALMAASVECSLWLIWSSYEDTAPVLNALAGTGLLPVIRVPPARLLADLAHPRRQARSWNTQANYGWPVLPTAEFTRFLAAARRYLSPREFRRVDELYRATADATDTWLAESDHLVGLSAEQVHGRLATWLRDEQLGPAESSPAALITLRAIQAALFLRGILLRWDVTTLGPEPEKRLPGELTEQVCQALSSMARTDHAAATALSLHLNQGPILFGCWRCGDVAPDGSTISPPALHHHTEPVRRGSKYAPGVFGVTDPVRTFGLTEPACQRTIRVPAHAQPLIAAHRAYRCFQQADDSDPFFIHPTVSPEELSPRGVLREGVIRTCARLRLNPPWMHRAPCRDGADVGLQPRAEGWMLERALSVHVLDPTIVAHVPRRIHIEIEIERGDR